MTNLDVRVTETKHMTILLALQNEMVKIKQRIAKEICVLRQENEKMKRRLEGTHLSLP